MKTKILSIFTLLLLTSCNNFNSFSLTSYELSVISETTTIEKEIKQEPIKESVKQPEPSIMIKEVPVIKDQIKYICPKFILPELEPFPSLPVEELNKLDPRDFEAIDKVLIRYISQVVKFDKYAREKITNSYNEYLKKC